MSAGSENQKKQSAPSPEGPGAAQSEIDQILNDIEELQQEMEKNSAPQLKVVPGGQESPHAEVASSEDDALSEFRSGASSEASLEDLADLKEDSESAGTSLLDQVVSADEEVAEEAVEEEGPEEAVGEVVDSRELEAAQESGDPEMEEAEAMHDSQDGTLTLKLQGQMTLKLQYEFEGQEVTIGFSDGCLKVQLADGTEFKVPVGAARPRPLRRAS